MDENIPLNREAAFGRNPFTLGLNPRCDFNNFWVGKNNRLAYTAAFAVAQLPSRTYNPLFIYGDVGLGKTHLLQAIGHYIINHRADLSFRYLSSEQFANELMEAIQNGKITEFRRRYRSIDILLMDDIHFLAGKEQTQEEFFHTFNSLYQAHKQIVLSSDRPPTEIPTLQKRLQSRFEGGLIADIQPPDLETRVAILKKKAEAEGLDLSHEVALFIAERVRTNIRRLEGCVVRLIAYSSSLGTKIDIDLAKQALEGIFPKEKPRVNALEKGLLSHLRGDLMADIQPPDLETRVAILKKKAGMENVDLPNKVALFIAERVRTNMRRLEDCLVRLIAYSSLLKTNINTDLTRQVLENLLPQEKPESIPIDLIQEVVSKYYKVEKSLLRGEKRLKSIAFPRQVAMYLCRELTGASFPKIGEKFGGKNHTTVIYAWRKIGKERERNERLTRELREIESLVKS